MEALIKIAADGLLVVIAAIGAVALVRGIGKQRILSEYPYAIMAGLTALLVAKLASLLYQPAIARPFIELGISPGALYVDNPGFPSDHALLAGVIVLAVAALTRYRGVAVLLGVLAIAMGIGRIAALVHTPLDVVGGFAAAIVGGIWYFARQKKLR